MLAIDAESSGWKIIELRTLNVGRSGQRPRAADRHHQHVAASSAGVFTVFLPVSAAAVGVFVLGEQFSGAQIGAFGLALAGVVLASWRHGSVAAPT
jgi:hypothetical protein